MEKRAYNFSAGPAVLPESVLKEVQEELLNYRGHGLSVMEMSHRSEVFDNIINDAKDAVKRITGFDDKYEILFLQGGASSQFFMIPMNLCPNNMVANYIDTGRWSYKAWNEAKKLGKKVHIAASSREQDYNMIPEDFEISENAAYLHITSNNTVNGTEFKKDIDSGDVPLVADMSSNIMSKPIDFEKYSLIYAGAQKNIGPAGVTMVIFKKELINQANYNLPTMLDYRTHIKKGSMFNTPPCFAIYVLGKVMHWIEDNGGLAAMAELNKKKAAKIYDIIDSTEFYRGTVEKKYRSTMNVTFRLPTEELEAKFIAEAQKHNMLKLKGHRSVGGCRASLYNALPMEAVNYLANFMLDFEKKNK